MKVQSKDLISQIVNRNFRAADVFAEYDIDFCCKGQRSLKDACEEKGIDLREMEQKLAEEASGNNGGAPDFRKWDADLLVDYIEKKHHRYVRKSLPVLTAYLAKIEEVHGHSRPELTRIRQTFMALAEELTAHMVKEEVLLFPMIKSLYSTGSPEHSADMLSSGSVTKPIEEMEQEHENAGDAMAEIAKRSNNFTPPPQACNTYKVAYAKLHEFEKDLHMHVHLENNVLFERIKNNQL